MLPLDNPTLRSVLQVVGFSPARYHCGLRLHQQLKSRIAVLLELRHNLDVDLRPWVLEAPSPSQAADRHAVRVSRYARVSELDGQIAMCQDFLAQLDSKSTIDQRPEWRSRFAEYLSRWPVSRLWSFCHLSKLPSIKDEVSRMLQDAAAHMRKSEYVQRLDVEIAQAVADGWFLLFESLTLDPLKEDQFFANPQAIRDHMRDIGRSVNVSLGRKSGDPYDDVFRYFAVPEYGRKNGRLHFHVLYFLKALPKGCVDPNLGRRVRNRRQVDRLRVWPYGFSAPIALRYSGDAFTRLGWLWPVDKDGKPLQVKPPIAIAKYVTKYVSKSFNEVHQWQKTNNPSRKRQFRVRMTRGFGTRINLGDPSLPTLLELASLHYSVTKKSLLLKRLAIGALSAKLANVSLANFLEQQPPRNPLLARLRDLIAKTPTLNLSNSAVIETPKLRLSDISDETLAIVRSVPALFEGNASVSGK